MRCCLLAVCTAMTSLGAWAGADPALAEQPKAVIELFTSQGCSSCPPADELLAKLSRQPGTITLSLPVDYWDYLGWKDTLARPEFTARQRSYSAARGDLQVYTPQAIVNGSAHAVGSSQTDINAAQAASPAGALTVPVDVGASDAGLTITIGADPAGGQRAGRVMLMPYLKATAVDIRRGENAHRQVRYTNVVREIIDVAAWDGVGREYKISRARLPEADGYVAILQSGDSGTPGMILGASQFSDRSTAAN